MAVCSAGWHCFGAHTHTNLFAPARASLLTSQRVYAKCSSGSITGQQPLTPTHIHCFSLTQAQLCPINKYYNIHSVFFYVMFALKMKRNAFAKNLS